MMTPRKDSEGSMFTMNKSSRLPSAGDMEEARLETEVNYLTI